MEKIASFKDLKVWREGIELVRGVYGLCAKLPKDELYGLSSQMRTAAVSVPSNIAEGPSRHHRADYRRFIYVAIGSLAELETQLHISKELGFLDAKAIHPVQERIGPLRGMLLTLGPRLEK